MYTLCNFCQLPLNALLVVMRMETRLSVLVAKLDSFALPRVVHFLYAKMVRIHYRIGRIALCALLVIVA